MKAVPLGSTGLRVSPLGIGTAALGMSYGPPVPGATATPAADQAVELVRTAVEYGVTFFDTAPDYGNSEEILGRALRGKREVVVSTKAVIPADGHVEERVRASLAGSRRRLGREKLDLVLLHSVSAQAFRGGPAGEALGVLRRDPDVGATGATVYGEDAAMAALDAKVDVIQIAVNLLDRRMLERVLPRAQREGVGTVARSVLLKGVLTPHGDRLPGSLQRVREAAAGVRLALGAPWERLPGLALQYVMGVPGVDAVLMGVRTKDELKAAVAAAEAGPLSASLSEAVQALEPLPPDLLDPSNWEG